MSIAHLIDPGPDMDQLVISQLIGDLRDLTEVDIRVLKAHGPEDGGQNPVLRMRSVHHQVARLLVQGFHPKEISEELGLSPTHINNLQRSSDAFKELLDYYQSQMTEAMVHHHKKIHVAAGLAVELVTEQLVENSENLTPDFKLRAMDKLLGYAGYTPAAKSEVVSLNGTLSKEDIDQIKAGAQAKELAHAIEVRVLSTEGQEPCVVGQGSSPISPAIPEVLSEDRRSPVGGGMEEKSAPQRPLEFPYGDSEAGEEV